MIKALKWIREQELKDRDWGCKWFAMAMWGDSPAWKRHYKIGHGTTSGKGMWLCAGSYLAKLEIKGLIYKSWDEYRWNYYMTKVGREVLNHAIMMEKENGRQKEKS